MRDITTQKTEFGYVIHYLSSEFTMEVQVRDLLSKPPVDQPYDRLLT